MDQSFGAAILKRDKFAIEDFLRAGADPNALILGEEFAPIHLGAGTSKSVTQLLLRYGADPNARTHEGSTPLHIAASWGKSGVLKLLLKYGADMSIRDNEELDALGVAGKYESGNCVHILQNHERKHEIDIQGEKHKSPGVFNQIEINVYLNRIKLCSTSINGSSKMFELPDQNYQFADQNFQCTDQNYQCADQNYQCADQNYQFADQDYQCADQNYQCADQNFQFADQNYQFADQNYQCADQNYQFADQNYQCADQNYQCADQNYQFADQNYQFAEEGPITTETYKTEEDENTCEFEQPDDDILTPSSSSSSLISLPVREEFSVTSPNEQVHRNTNNEEEHLSDDQRLEAKIRQESSVHKNSVTKIEYALIHKQNRFHTDTKSGSGQRRKEAFEKPSGETFVHPSLSSQHIRQNRSESNFPARQQMISTSDFNDVLSQHVHQSLNAETVDVDQGSYLTLPNMEYHLDLGSETGHDGWDQTDPQISDRERNKESVEYEQWNDHSNYQSQKMSKNDLENIKSPSLNENTPRVVHHCNNHLRIKTNPLCKPKRKMCRKCWNMEFCAETEEHLHTSHLCGGVSDSTYPDNISQNSKYECVYVEDSKDEIYVRSYDPCTEASEPAAKQNPFRKYSKNLYLKFAASADKGKGRLPMGKLASMKKVFSRISNCRVCLATKAMFTRWKSKIVR